MTLDAHIRPLDLHLRPSRCRRAVAAALHLLAFAALLAALAGGLLPPVASAALLLAVVAAAVVDWRSTARDCRVHWGEDQFIELQRDGESRPRRCRLQADSRLWSVLVVLHLRDQCDRHLYLPVWPDQLDARAFRHLRVRLTLDGQRALAAGEQSRLD